MRRSNNSGNMRSILGDAKFSIMNAGGNTIALANLASSAISSMAALLSQ
jgi:hypothetical protein